MLGLPLLGGYTTFSSFSLEAYAVLRVGAVWLAVLNAVGSVLLGLIVCCLGVQIAQKILRRI